LLVASALATLVGYLFVAFDQGHGWGFRYFHAVWFALPLFAAASLTRMHPSESSGETFANGQVRAFITACALLTLTVGVGQRALQINDFVSSEVSQGPRYRGDDARVVIYRNSMSRWGNVLEHNDPWLRNNEIHVYSHGREADAKLMRERFPGLHEVYQDFWGSVWSDHGKGAQ
jgi:hypothetical protein